MNGRPGVKRDTDIWGWNRRWDVMQCYCHGYLDPTGLLHTPMVRHEDESNCVLSFTTVVEHAETNRGLTALKAYSIDRQYDQYILILDADARSRELDMELGH